VTCTSACIAVLWSLQGTYGSGCVTGIMVPLCRPELVPEVKRAYEQLGGWMRPGQLPLVYHPVYNIGTGTSENTSCIVCHLCAHVLLQTFCGLFAACAVGKSRGRASGFSCEPTSLFWPASSM